jgi:hypothetical protein
MKHPTLRKLRNRGLTPIRYHNGQQYVHGWIIEHGARGTMRVQIVGEERARRLSREEARYVKQL